MPLSREKLALCLLVFISALGVSSAALKAADYFKLCKRNDPQLNECVRNSIMDLRPVFKKGIPELKIPPLDPMIVPRISVNQGGGPVSISSSFKDLHIQGFTNTRVDEVKVDLPNHRIDMKCSLDWFYAWGDYDIKGQILVLPISGSGPSWSNYTEVTGRGLIVGHEVAKKNKTHFAVDDVQFEMDVGHATINMENLFNGNKALGETMNRFMSENWKAVYGELRPVINQAVSGIFGDVIKKIFDKFPLDDLFPM